MDRIVVISCPIPEVARERVCAAAPDMTFHFVESEANRELIDRAEVLFGQYYRMEHLPAPGRLRWLHVISSGVDRFFKSGALPEDVLLTCSTGAYGTAISEFMLGQLLTLNYRFHVYRDNQRQGLWRDEGYPRTISGQTALILGLGDIGGSFAKLLHGMGVYTIGVSRTASRKPDYADELYAFDDHALDELFPRADIVALALPATPQTFHMLNRSRIASLRKNVFVLNVGRGSAIDEDAMIVALGAGRIQGAALDVFQEEPLSGDSPLWSLKNVLLTPHIAGRDYMPEIIRDSTELFLRNLSAYYNGRPLENVVDRNLRYASRNVL